MKQMREKLRRVAAAVAVAVAAASVCAAQDDAFKKLEAIDYARQTVTRAQLQERACGS